MWQGLRNFHNVCSLQPRTASQSERRIQSTFALPHEKSFYVTENHWIVTMVFLTFFKINISPLLLLSYLQGCLYVLL